jgi:hypothetical protein
MKTRCLVALLVATLSAVCSCASAPIKGADAPDTDSTPSAAQEPVSTPAETSNVSGYETEVNECNDRTCVGNSDCCDGYSCGFDPERSRVQRYCLRG